MPKRESKRPLQFNNAWRKISPEIRVAGFVIIILGVLLAYDFILSPEETADKVSRTTGNIVAEVKEKVAEKREPEPEPVKQVTEVRILSPPKGSTQSGDFTVKVQVPSGSALCYYQIKDSGSTTWDRRTRSCGQDVVVKEVFCKSGGVNTCYVYYAASSSDGSAFLGSDEAYYSIE